MHFAVCGLIYIKIAGKKTLYCSKLFYDYKVDCMQKNKTKKNLKKKTKPKQNKANAKYILFSQQIRIRRWPVETQLLGVAVHLCPHSREFR